MTLHTFRNTNNLTALEALYICRLIETKTFWSIVTQFFYQALFSTAKALYFIRVYSSTVVKFLMRIEKII